MPRGSFPTLLCSALALAGCAAPSATPAAPDGRMDGTYVGTRTLDPICGTQTERIRFDVAGSRIWVHVRRGRATLEGTVTADGQVALTDFAGSRHINGTIGQGRLTASELLSGNGNKNRRKTALDELTPVTCLWHFDAVRAGTAAGPDGTTQDDGRVQ